MDKPDVVVVDSYLADCNFYKEISKLAKIPVFIDDTGRIKYPPGIIINGSISAQRFNYPAENGRVYLLGTKYIPIRKEFWEVREKATRDKLSSVLVTFGGSDFREMTPYVLRFLTENYPEIKKYVVIGGYFSKKLISSVKNFKDENTELIYNPDAKSLKRIMLNSDVAISAGGQTLYELARVGVPTIAVAVSDNQFVNIDGWLEAGFVKYAGWYEDKNLLKNIEKYLQILSDKNTRSSMARIGRKFVDGMGARRIAKFIKNFLTA